MKLNNGTHELLQELQEKHRAIKKQIFDLLGKSESPMVTKAKIKDELFKLYLEIK